MIPTPATELPPPRPPRRRPLWWRLCKRLAVLAIIAIATLAVLEIGVRILAPVDRFEYIPNTFDPICQIRQEAHARGFIDCPEYHIQIRTNGGGLREDREIPYARPAGQERILCLGDSFTNGFGVPRRETFAAYVEDDLADSIPTIVIDAGVGGTGTAQQLAWYVEEGQRYDAACVVISPSANDFGDNVQSGIFTLGPGDDLVQHPAHQSPLLHALRLLRRVPGYTTWFARSQLLNAFKERFARWYHGRRATAAAQGEPAAEVAAREDTLTFALLRRLRQECERRGAALIVMPVPALPGSGTYEQQMNGLYDELARTGFVVVDLRADFAEARARGEVLEYPVDGHWNAAGHRLAAAALLAAIGR